MVQHEPLISFDGPIGRWPAWVVLSLGLLGGLVTYLLVGNLAVVVWLLLEGVTLSELLADPAGTMAANIGALLGGNAIGLGLGLGVIALVLARLDTSVPLTYLRMRPVGLRDVSLALLGLVALLPAVSWLGKLNELLPMPEFIRSLEAEQMQIIEWILSGEGNIALNLVLIAAAPAFFEEVFFRGFVLRRAERSMGIAWGIIFSGVIFGIFHLRLTQALPLSVLGIYMAWCAWRTRSLWVPVAVHFLNNALAVAVAEWGVGDSAEIVTLPWPWVIIGCAVFAVSVRLLHTKRRMYV